MERVLCLFELLFLLQWLVSGVHTVVWISVCNYHNFRKNRLYDYLKVEVKGILTDFI